MQTAKGRRTGGVPGGGPGGVKGTGGFPKISPYLNWIFVFFFVFVGRILWHLDSRYLKHFCPEKGLQNILKPNGRNSNSRPPYRNRTKASNWRWTLPVGELSKHTTSHKQCAFDLRERHMLCPERDEIRLGVHNCLGSRRPMLCPGRDDIR